MIHVCYALSDKDEHYSKFTGASIASIFENTKSPITIHLLHDDTMTSDNHEKFVVLANRYAQKIEFYNVEQIVKEIWTLLNEIFPSLGQSEHINVACMYRLLALDLLPVSIDRLIYFDADVIVNMDVADFYRESLEENGTGNGLAAVIDEPIQSRPGWSHLCQIGVLSLKDYFNSGVLLMDIQRLRANYPNFQMITQGVEFLASHPTNFADQDILNYLFQKGCRKLPEKYNLLVTQERERGQTNLKEAIYHFAGWAFNLRTEEDIYSRMFFRYLLATPWADANLIGRLSSLTKERFTEKTRKQLMQVANLFARKKRVFIFPPSIEEKIRTAFSIQPVEECIFSGATANLPIDLSRKDKVYIFFVSNYEAIKNMLLQNGCTEWEDFIDGRYLFQSEHLLNVWEADGFLHDKDDYTIIRVA